MPSALSYLVVRRLLLGANLAAPLALLATCFAVPWIIYAALAAHAAYFYAIVRPACAWFGPVATRFKPTGREVWLTIDDGPDGTASEHLVAELAERGVRVTFFVKGENLQRYPFAVRRILAGGHTLANHTQSHPAIWFWALRFRRLRTEIEACNAALHGVGVSITRWFRAPVGLKHPRLHPLLAARGMRLVGWSVRGGDGLACDPAAVARRVIAAVHTGAIILLHEGRPRSNEAILQVVDELQHLGYTFVIPEDDQLV